MSLKIKVLLYATCIAVSFISIMIVSYHTAKEHIACNKEQNNQLIYYTLKTKTNTLLDAMLDDYTSAYDLVKKKGHEVSKKLQKNPHVNLESFLGGNFIDIALFDLDATLHNNAKEFQYLHRKHLLRNLKEDGTTFFSTPLYEKNLDTFIGYGIMKITHANENYLLVLSYDHGNYEKQLAPIRQYLHNHPHIQSIDAYINCRNGHYDLFFPTTHIATQNSIAPKHIYKKASLEEVVVEDAKDGVSKLLYVKEQKLNSNNNLGLSYLIVINHDQYTQMVSRQQKELALVFIFGILFIFLSYFFIKKVFLNPLQLMQEAVNARKPLRDDKLLNQNDELGVLARNINQSCKLINNKLSQKEQLLHEQDIFVKDSIHEIRTPLSIITLNNELRDSLYGKDKYSKQIEAATKSLNLSYEDLSFSILQEREGFEKEYIELDSLLKERIAFVKSIAEVANKEINFTQVGKCKVLMSYSELCRLIDNNLSNAIKYAYPNTKIEISLYAQNSDYAILRFTTHGQPIKDSQKIFQRYKRENSVKGGYGLGLSIVFTIAQKYDIKIDVITQNKTNTFEYRFEV